MNTFGSLFRLSLNSPEFKDVLEMDQFEFPRPWSEKDWASVNWEHHQLFGLIRENLLEGFALFSCILGDDTSHLLKICLKSSLRGGPSIKEFWGELCMELRHLGIKKIYLEVEAKNQRALGFYRKSGFITLRIIKGYYSNGEDAHTMQLTL